MCFANSIQHILFPNFLVRLIFLLLSQDYFLRVNTKLLEQFGKSLNTSGENDTVYRFQSNSHVLPLTTESLVELDLYCNFLGSYGEFREWTNAKLIFPETILPEHCDYFRNALLRSAGLQTTCVENKSENENQTDYNTEQIHSDAKDNPWLTDDPVVFLHFLTVNPKNVCKSHFLTEYLYKSSNKILILTRNLTSGLLIEQLKPETNLNYKLTLGSLTKQKNGSMIVEIQDIYGFATSKIPVSQSLGFWSFLDGIQIEERKLLGLDNFQGKLIRITSVEGNPVVYLDRNTSTREVKGRGYLPDILDSLSLFLNFKYILLEPLDKSFGSKDASGNWSGMVGMLIRKEAEMALMSFSLTRQRKEAMDFSPPVEYSATRLLIRRDFENTELKWESFVSPFHWTVWFAIPFTIFLGVLTLMVFTQFDLLESTPLTSTALLFCCFLNQGMEGHSYFRKFPSRIVLGSFWVLAVVIYASYTARLTSFLAATTDTLPFKSLLEAVQNRNWKIGLVKGSSFRDRVREAPEPEMKLLSKRIDEDSSIFVRSFVEGVEKVYNEKYIFFTSDLVPSFMVKGNCSYTWIPGKYFPGFGYMGFQKNLPFASAISHRVAQIRETGQMKRLMRKWWGDEASCSANGADAFAGMSLYETATAFLIIIVGISLAVIVLAGEFLIRPKKQSLDSCKEIKLSNGNSSLLETNFRDSKLPADFHNRNTQPRHSNSDTLDGLNLNSHHSQNSLTFGKSEYSDSESILQTTRKDYSRRLQF